MAKTAALLPKMDDKDKYVLKNLYRLGNTFSDDIPYKNALKHELYRNTTETCNVIRSSPYRLSKHPSLLLGHGLVNNIRPGNF